MGFSARTTIKAGPFRFTASRSGLNVSTGVPGLRVGSGPRGNYVSIGGQGVRYRTSAAAGSSRRAGGFPTHHAPTSDSPVLMTDTTGATALELTPSTSDDLVAQLNSASRHRGLGRWGVGAALLLGAVPSLSAGRSALYFLPDRLLVREGKVYSDVSYDHLRVASGTERFIENPRDVPSDALQVDRTWQYVNVKGGPDRRFKDNPQLPVIRYGTIHLTTGDGLVWLIQVSRDLAATQVASSLSSRPPVIPPR